MKARLFIPLSGLIFLLVSCGGSDNDVPLASNTHASQSTAQGLYNTAYAQDQAGNTKRALKSYNQIAEKYPLSAVGPDARFRHAQILDSQGKHLEAFDSYQLYLSRYPSGAKYGEALARQEAVAHATAAGEIKNNFLGMKSRFDGKRIAGMLTKVRENAPHSKNAAKTQFMIGETYESTGKHAEAIQAYRKTAFDYADSSYAPEAQLRIGKIYVSQVESGSQNQSNLERAKEAFNDLILEHPRSKQAGQARAEIAKLGSADVDRAYRVAEFYRKGGQPSSAIFYYREVIRLSKSGTLHDQAQQRLRELGQ